MTPVISVVIPTFNRRDTLAIMPTGGVSPDEENLAKWFKAGVHCVGMGSQLFPAEVLKKEDFNYIAAKCREALESVRKIKAS